MKQHNNMGYVKDKQLEQRNPILLDGIFLQKVKLFGMFITLQRQAIFRQKNHNT